MKSTPGNDSDRITGKMNPLVSKVHGKEKRWSAEYAALRQLCLESGLNEELKWGQACYDLSGCNVVLIHGGGETIGDSRGARGETCAKDFERAGSR